MTLAQWFVAVPTVCYAGAAVAYAAQRDPKSAWLFAGYAFANLSFLLWR